MLASVTFTLKIFKNPPVVGSYRPDKIFGGIPGGSDDFMPHPFLGITIGGDEREVIPKI
jgi:hypothetical protein